MSGDLDRHQIAACLDDGVGATDFRGKADLKSAGSVPGDDQEGTGRERVGISCINSSACRSRIGGTLVGQRSRGQ